MTSNELFVASVLVCLVLLGGMVLIGVLLKSLLALTATNDRDKARERRDAEDRVMRMIEKVQLAPERAADIHARERTNRIDGEAMSDGRNNRQAPLVPDEWVPIDEAQAEVQA